MYYNDNKYIQNNNLRKMSTLRETIAAWRGTNQKSNPIKQLNIGNTLYDLKDPAVEALADAIETRLSTVESKKIRTEALTKTSDAKFATAVTQTVDGDIAVTYGNIRDTALEDTAVTGQFVTSVSQGVDGQISLTRGGVNSENVAFTSTSGNITSANVKAALEEIYANAMALKGTSTDASSAETIAAAKKYADEKVQQLAGEDWTVNAQKVQDIINELGGDNADWSTLVDKLAGMTYTSEGQQVEATSVADYVAHKIAEVNAANADGINALDAVVYGGSNGTSSAGSEGETAFIDDTKSKVAVKITEVDGKITTVNVKTNDIASQADLTTLDGAVVKSVNSQTPINGAVTIKGDNIQLSASDTTLISTAIAALQSGKKNSSEITEKTVQVVSTVTRDSSTECLTITLANENVLAPVTA